MPATTNRSLFLQVGADVSPLTAQMKAGRTALLSLSDAAVDMQAEVQKQLAAISADPNALKQLEASYRATFDNIRRTAQAALAVNDNAGALKLIDAGGAQEAAKAAEAQAAQLRLAANAAAAVAERQGEAGQAARALAVALEVQATDAAKVSIALATQADIMAEVAAEARVLGAREDEVTGAHARMGSSGLIAEHVVRSLSDSIAAGQSPVRALTMEMGRITEAMTLYAQQTEQTEGAMGRFASFMGGPWGLAVSAGVALLTPLIAGLLETSDKITEETEKLRANAVETAAAEAAKKLFMTTEAGALADVRALTEELRKQNEELKTNAERQNIRAKERLQTLQGKRATVVGEISDTQSDLRLTQAGPPTDAATAKIGALEIRLRQLKTELSGIDVGIAQATADRATTDADLSDEAAKRAIDPLEQIKKKYDGAGGIIDLAKQHATQEEKMNGTLERRLVLLRQQQKNETEAEQKRQREANRSSNGDQVGRQVTLQQAEEIVTGIGGRVTSAQRSTAQQQVLYDRYLAGKGPLAAKPGTSLHESGQALDVAKTAGITLAALKDAFREAGVHLTEALDEGDHYHVGFGKKGPSADTLARRRQAQTRKAANDDRGFLNSDRAIDDAIARQKLQLSGSIEEEYQLRVAEIVADTDAKNRAIQDEVTAGRLTQVQADQLKLKNDELGILEEQVAARKKQLDEINGTYEADRDARQFAIEQAQIEESLADTREERYAAAKRGLSGRQAQTRADLQHTIDINPEGSEQRTNAQAQLARLPALESAQNAQLAKDSESPLERYRDELKGSLDDVGDTLKVDGLKDLENGLGSIISRSKDADEAIRNMVTSMLAELAKLAVEKLILSFIGLKGGGSPATGSSSILPGFAGGGDPSVENGIIRGPGTGTSDSILALVSGRKPIRISRGEAIVNERGVRKHAGLIDAINHDRLPTFATGGFVDYYPSIPTSYPAMPSVAAMARPAPPPQVIYVQIDKSEMFDAHVSRIAAPMAQAAMVGGAAQAQQDFADRQMGSIPI